MPFSSVCVLRWCRSGGGTVSTVSLSVSQRVSVSRSGLLAVRRPNDGLRAPRARLYRLTHWLTGRHTDCPPRCESCRYCALRAVRWCALVAPMLSLPRNCGRQDEKSASERACAFGKKILQHSAAEGNQLFPSGSWSSSSTTAMERERERKGHRHIQLVVIASFLSRFCSLSLSRPLW